MVRASGLDEDGAAPRLRGAADGGRRAVRDPARAEAQLEASRGAPLPWAQVPQKFVCLLEVLCIVNNSSIGAGVADWWVSTV